MRSDGIKNTVFYILNSSMLTRLEEDHCMWGSIECGALRAGTISTTTVQTVSPVDLYGT